MLYGDVSSPYVIGTMNQTASCSAADLQMHHNFRWVLYANHIEPVRSFLGRYLRRQQLTTSMAAQASSFARGGGAIPTDHTHLMSRSSTSASQPYRRSSAASSSSSSSSCGWGATDSNGTRYPYLLQRVSLPYLGKEYNYILPDHLFAGGNSDQGICFGDSGGPLLSGNTQYLY